MRLTRQGDGLGVAAKQAETVPVAVPHAPAPHRRALTYGGEPNLQVLDGFADGHELLRARFLRAEACPVAGAAHLLRLQRPAPVAQGVAALFARHPLPGSRARPRAPLAAAHEGAR